MEEHSPQAQRIRAALDKLIMLPSLKQKTQSVAPADQDGINVALSDHAGQVQQASCRPWDRADLFRRMLSYKPGTWFCKPAPAGPVECARRGWVNTGCDLLSCEFCQAKLSFPLPVAYQREEAQKMAAAFAEKLVTGHDKSCPWRQETCTESLAQFPPLSAQQVAEDYSRRLAALQRVSWLPPVATEALDRMKAADKVRLDRFLGRGAAASANVSEAAACPGDRTLAAQRLLALCGWEVKEMGGPRPTTAVQQSTPLAGPTPATDSGTADPPGLATSAAPAGALDPSRCCLQCPICGASVGLWLFMEGSGPNSASLHAGTVPLWALPGTSRSTASSTPGQQAVPRLLDFRLATKPNSTIRRLRAPPSGLFSHPPSIANRIASPGPGVRQHPAVLQQLSHTIAGGSFNSAAAPFEKRRRSEASPGGALELNTGVQLPPAQLRPFGQSGGDNVPAFGIAVLKQPSVPGPRPAPSQPRATQVQVDATPAGSTLKRKACEPAAEPPKPCGSSPAEVGGASCRTGTETVGVSGDGSGRAGRPHEQAAAAPAVAATMTHLNPLALHRPFCPWANSNGPEGRCGWTWTLEALVPGSDMTAAGTASSPASRSPLQGEPMALLRAIVQMGHGGLQGDKANLSFP